MNFTMNLVNNEHYEHRDSIVVCEAECRARIVSYRVVVLWSGLGGAGRAGPGSARKKGRGGRGTRVERLVSGSGSEQSTLSAMRRSLRKKSADAWLSPPSAWIGSTIMPASSVTVLRFTLCSLIISSTCAAHTHNVQYSRHCLE